MKKPNFPLATSTWDEKEIEAIHSVVNSGLFTMGKETLSFEEEFADFFGSKHAVMVNSGSSANLLMIASMFFTKNDTIRLKRGDEVIVPAVSWSTTYFPLQQYGLKIKFVDIDLETLNFDLGKLKTAVTAKTKVILAVNLLGNPNDYDTIYSIIGDKNVTILEDNCEAMGSKINMKYCGTFGLMGTFSTFFSHHISTMEGGLVVTEDEEIYHILLSLRAHGWTRNLPKKNQLTGMKSANKFDESFNFVLPGYNLRPTEFSGAIGREQLKKLPKILKGRLDNGRKFKDIFGGHPEFIIQKEIGTSSWFGFSIIIRDGSKLCRKDLIEMLEDEGIEYRPIVAGNFSAKKVMKYLDYEVFGQLKNADYLDKNGLFIGNHHYALDDLFNRLKSIL